MIEFLLDPEIWAALFTLTVLEIVLGIDNLVFLAIISNRLPAHQRALAQRIGLMAALGLRVGLLLTLTWITQATTPVMTISNYPISWRDLILGVGGLYLMYKGVKEIHEAVEGGDGKHGAKPPSSFASVITQIMILDLVFSLDSIITAVGMTNNRPVMIAAIVISILVMMFAAGAVSGFINKHPTVKMLALSFLILVGTALVADAAHFHIPRGYLYFAIAFAIVLESLNMLTARARNRHKGAPAKDTGR
ncbi:MAG: TerC family protein [Rhodospirillaceae bacterium]|nr:TerC family protein [Rhodospirillaceae bacterium]